MGIFRTYVLDLEDSASGIVPFNSFWDQSIAESRYLGRYFPFISVELPRVDLTRAYYAISLCARNIYLQMLYQQGQHYVPGSILTVHGQTLVGGIRDRSWLREWKVHWRGPPWSSENLKDFFICLPSTDWFVTYLTFVFMLILDC